MAFRALSLAARPRVGRSTYAVAALVPVRVGFRRRPRWVAFLGECEQLQSPVSPRLYVGGGGMRGAGLVEGSISPRPFAKPARR